MGTFTPRVEVTREYTRVAPEHFRRLDTNHDGVVTLDDFSAPAAATKPPALATVLPPWLHGAIANETVTRPAFNQAVLVFARGVSGTGVARFERAKFSATPSLGPIRALPAAHH